MQIFGYKNIIYLSYICPNITKLHVKAKKGNIDYRRKVNEINYAM